MLILLDHEVLKPALVHVPRAHGVVGDLPAGGVGETEIAEESREFIVLPRPGDEMPVVGHDAPGQNPDRIPGMSLEQDVIKGQEVGVFVEQSQLSVCAVEDVINQSTGSNASYARHGWIMPRAAEYVKGRVPFSLAF